MGYYLNLGALVAIASAVVMLTLGGLVLRLDPRDKSARLFGFFVLLWAAEIVAGNMLRLSTEASVLYPWAIAFQALALIAAVPLLVFALTYPPSHRPLLSRRVAWALTGLPALAGLGTLAIDPSLFVVDTQSVAGVTSVEFGPLAGLVSAWFVLSFLVATAIIGYRFHRSRKREERSRLGLLQAALTVWVSYEAGLTFTWMGPFGDNYQSIHTPFSYWLIAGVLGLCLLATLAILVRAARQDGRRWRNLQVASASVPLLATVGVQALRTHLSMTFDLVGVWRLGMVGLFAYTLSRYRLFDLEPKLKDAAPVAAYLVTTGLGLAVTWGGFGQEFGETWWTGTMASIGVLACAWPSMSVTETLLDRKLTYVGEDGYLYKRKLEVYRGALEDARAEGLESEEEQRFLANLRDRLDIDEREHQILTLLLDSERDRLSASPGEPTDRFEVLEELGTGSLGRALLVHDTTLEREVVLKEATGAWALGQDGRDLFRREARLAAQLNHPNVVQVYETLPDREPPTLVLEYVEGESLKEKIEKRGQIPIEELADWLADILQGLEALHDRGIVHRDLKPANLLITPEGRAKITDLGVAHPPEELDVDLTLPTDGDQPGTLAYMSPEQIRGETIDERSDLYSLAAVTYRALTGRHHFGTDELSRWEAKQRISNQSPDLDDSELRPVQATFLKKGLAQHPEDRFQSAAEMRRALPTVTEGRARVTRTRTGDERGRVS